VSELWCSEHYAFLIETIFTNHTYLSLNLESPFANSREILFSGALYGSSQGQLLADALLVILPAP